MEFNKSVSNPMLVGCIELIKEEDTPDHRNMFVAELTKALMLSPALIDPAPEEGEGGELKLVQGSKVQFPLIAAPDRKMFHMAFTDAFEYEKWQEKTGQKLPTFALGFDDYAAMLLRKDPKGNLSPALGIIINPMGAGIVVPREMVAGVIASRVTKAQQAAARRSGNPGQPIPFPGNQAQSAPLPGKPAQPIPFPGNPARKPGDKT